MDAQTEAMPESDSTDEGEIMCPGCLAVVEFDQLLCHRCGCPQDFLSATVPYISILSEGYIYRRAVWSPQHTISVIGIWVLFAQYLGVGTTMLIQSWTMRSSQDLVATIALAAMGVLFVLIGICGPIQSSLNFRKTRHANEV